MVGVVEGWGMWTGRMGVVVVGGWGCVMEAVSELGPAAGCLLKEAGAAVVVLVAV
jgi:hypothetical protein